MAVFDITPTRLTLTTSLGWYWGYYSEKLSLKSFSDVGAIFDNNNIELLWKQKRIPGRKSITNGYILRRDNIISDEFTIVDPNVSAARLIEQCDAVISMPFTSTAIIGEKMGKPPIYYDASGDIDLEGSHGITVITNKRLLKNWRDTLEIE